jgi:hypothetical protein
VTTHPNIRFRVIGYGSKHQDDQHVFPPGSFDDVIAAFPVGSTHDHVPAPPCRYDVVTTGERSMEQERAQLVCGECYKPGIPEDNRRAPGA